MYRKSISTYDWTLFFIAIGKTTADIVLSLHIHKCAVADDVKVFDKPRDPDAFLIIPPVTFGEGAEVQRRSIEAAEG